MPHTSSRAIPHLLQGLSTGGLDHVRQILESITDPFYVIDAETFQVVMSNAAGGQLPEGSLPCCYAFTHHRDTRCDGVEHPCPMVEVKASRRPVVVEHRHGTGERQRLVEVRAFPITNSKGDITHIAEYCVDITERKLAEAELRDARDQLERRVSERGAELEALEAFSDRILETMSQGVVQIDEDGIIEYLNSAAATLTGHRAEDLRGTSSLELVPPDQLYRLEAAEERRSQGLRDSYEIELLHRDGSRLPVLVSAVPLLDGRRPTGTLCVLTDLSAVRSVEGRLRRRLKEFGALGALSRRITSSLSLDRVVEATLDGVMEAVNPDFVALYLAEGERLALRGLVVADDFTPESHDDAKPLLGHCVCARAASTGKELFLADLATVNDPALARCVAAGLQSLAAVPLRFGDQVLGSIGVGSASPSDLGDYREFLHALASQVGIAIYNALDHAKLKATLSAIPDLMFEVDLDGLITGFHAHSKDDLTLPPEAFLGRRVADVLPEDASHPIMKALEQAAITGIHHGATYSLDFGHETRHYEMSVAAKDLENDGRSSFVAVCRDVTQQREFERRSQHARKMEAIGRFAARIAHDFNNSLMVIQGGLDLMERGQARDPEAREEIVEAVRRATRNASQLTRSMLGFSRLQPISALEVDIHALIEETLPMLRRVLPPTVELTFVRGKEDLPSVKCEVTQIQQILINLCANSRDAMPEGGVITLQTGCLRTDDEYLDEHPWAEPGDYVFFAVTDTGVGMDTATAARALDPFFTTKGPGEGTGLGLSSAYSDLKRHGGMIDIISEPGVGTTCVAYLPAFGPHRPQPSRVEAHDEVTGGSETVVVVDDDDDLRRVLSGLLRSLGYHVITMTEGRDLLRHLGAKHGHVDLVVSDLGMPRMTGADLCALSREAAPGLRFLFCSGSASGWLEMDESLRRNAAFLKKPFDVQALAQALRELLDARPE